MLSTSAVLVACAPAWAAVVYSEDFDVDHTANWTVNVVPSSQCFAEFFFDYASVGIPSAPNSLGGTTRGLRLRANVSGNVTSGISVSPTGQSFIRKLLRSL